jgi:Holliday junction DNA helicase RuvA
MYAFIKGKLVEKTPAYVVIETAGIGFQLQVSINTFSRIKDQENCSLFTHLTIREDAHLLYGFYSEEERKLFRQLISVSGVGTSTAMLILSAYTPEELVSFIVNGEVARLKSVKGIGAKTAQRIIVDLKDRFDKGEISLEKLDIEHNTIKEEALSGLTVLGFNKKASEKAIQQVLTSAQDQGESIADLSVEKLIKDALKLL